MPRRAAQPMSRRGMLASRGSYPEPVEYQPADPVALAADFALVRMASDPRFRDYVHAFAGVRTDVHWLSVLPGESAATLLERLYQVGSWPAIVGMPDESQPFGYRLLVVTGPDAATVAGWRSTLAIHDDPELHAALTAPVDLDDLPDEAPALAAVAKRPRRFRRT